MSFLPRLTGIVLTVSPFSLATSSLFSSLTSTVLTVESIFTVEVTSSLPYRSPPNGRPPRPSRTLIVVPGSQKSLGRYSKW